MWQPTECRFPKSLIPRKVEEVPKLYTVHKVTYPGEKVENMRVLPVTVEELINNVNSTGWYNDGGNHLCMAGPGFPHGRGYQETTAEDMVAPQEWWGGISLKDILDRAIYKPAVKNISNLQEIARRKIPEALSPRRRAVLHREDGELLVERFAARKDAIFRNLKRGVRAGSGMFLNLYVCVEGHCGRDASEIMWTGLPAVAFADIAEAAGYRCRIFYINMSVHSHTGPEASNSSCFVPLKDYNEVLDPERMLFYLGCPGFFRAIMLCGYRLAGACVSSGYGQPPRNLEMVERGLKSVLPQLGWSDESRTYVFGETFDKKQATALLETRITQLLGQRDLFTEEGERVDE